LSLLREFEQKLEAVLEGFFTRQFKSGVQPIEIAKKLVRSMDANRTISVSKLYVPNRYTILLSENDLEKLKPFEKTLVTEFQGFLLAHARKEGYELLGRPKIELEGTPELSLGEIIIENSLESRGIDLEELEWFEPSRERPAEVDSGAAFIVMIGAGTEKKFLLSGSNVKIGRSSDNHIVIPDPNASRRHAEIVNEGAKYLLKDLGSTNGTYVNGSKIKERELKDGDKIAIGATKFYFRREAGV